MNIELIKELRSRTGASIKQCKECIEQSQGDVEKAIFLMKKQGLIKTASRAHKQTNCGIISIKKHNNKASILEINCETDFVARSKDFINLAQDIINILHENQDVESNQIKDLLESINIFGEKIVIKRSNSISAPVIGHHIFQNSIGAIVGLNQGSQELADNIATHIAAENPIYLDTLSEKIIEQEKDIVKAQFPDKEQDMIEKILQGRLEKIKQDMCLLNQNYLKDETITIKKLIKDSKILTFIRYSIDE